MPKRIAIQVREHTEDRDGHGYRLIVATDGGEYWVHQTRPLKEYELVVLEHTGTADWSAIEASDNWKLCEE